MEEVAVPMFCSLVLASILICTKFVRKGGFSELGDSKFVDVEIVYSVNFRVESLDFKLGISKEEKIVVFNVCLALEDKVTWLPQPKCRLFILL